MNRRDFLHISLSSTGFFVLGFQIKTPDSKEGSVWTEINGFVKISPNNEFVILAPRGDIGTSVKTSLPMLIAEEMNLDWEQVQVEFPNKIDRKYCPQGGGGSYAVRSSWLRLRTVGAAIKDLMLTAAANTWQVQKEECSTEKGIVFLKNTTKQFRFADLVEKAKILPIPETPTLKSPKEYKIIGKSIKDVDTEAIVTGKPIYGSDIQIDGMLYANIIKPPVLGAKIVRFDESKAKKIKGFVGVVKLDTLPNPTHQIGGLAVLGNSHWTVLKARKLIEIEWDKGFEGESSDKLSSDFERIINNSTLKVIQAEGDLETAKTNSKKHFEATYEVPLLAHATMEPMNFTAYVQPNKCELWGSTQVPNSVFRQAKNLLNLPDEAIAVHLCRSGGGFGRRLLVDYAIDAILISKQIQKPVQVFWTREDDFTHDYYRPAGMYRIKAGLDEVNKLNYWQLQASSLSRFVFRQDASPNHWAEVSAENFPIGFVSHFKLEYDYPSTKIPTGAWRAPADNATAFAIQSAIDELALLAEKDPIDFRLEMIGDSSQTKTQNPEDSYNAQDLKAILQIVREKSGWGKLLPKGRFQGVATHVTFGVPGAQIVEISMENDKPKIHKVVVAVACGQVVNPTHAEHQVIGAVLDGLSAALYGKITFENGAAKEINFHRYQLLRMFDTPKVEVYFLPSVDGPKGLGEMALPPIAPALCNAIFAATGKRIRKLPIVYKPLRD